MGYEGHFVVNYGEPLMAVLCEGISFTFRLDSINKFYQGGWLAFQEDLPRNTMCTAPPTGQFSIGVNMTDQWGRVTSTTRTAICC